MNLPDYHDSVYLCKGGKKNRKMWKKQDLLNHCHTCGDWNHCLLANLIQARYRTYDSHMMRFHNTGPTPVARASNSRLKMFVATSGYSTHF